MVTLKIGMFLVMVTAIGPTGVGKGIYKPTFDLARATPAAIGCEVLLPEGCGDCVRLGVACALGEDMLFLADDGERDGPAQAGFIARYELLGEEWQHCESFTAPSPLQGDRFGAAIALDGDCLVVGAPGDPLGGVPGGSAWLFRLSGGTWYPEARLSPTLPLPGARFGEAVALQGDRVVVGAPRLHLNGHWHVGSVEVFHHRNGAWKREAVLDPPIVATSLWFGESVALGFDATRLAIGMPGFDGPVNRSGGIITASRSGNRWTVNPRALCRPTADPLERLGSALASTGSTILGGAPGAEPGGAGLLAVASFEPTSKLLGEVGHPRNRQARLGSRLASNARWAAASMPGLRSEDEALGGVRLYTLNHGRPEPILDLVADPGSPPLGTAIAIHSDNLLVTAVPAEDDLPAEPRAWVIPLTTRVDSALE